MSEAASRRRRRPRRPHAGRLQVASLRAPPARVHAQVHPGTASRYVPGRCTWVYPAVLAFAGLRGAEACGLRVTDVDLDEMAVTPMVQYSAEPLKMVQYPAEPLKTESSVAAVPIPTVFVGELKRLVDGRAEGWVLFDAEGVQLGPWKVERHMRRIRKQVPGLSPEFRFHDLRHYYASMLIASGADVKVVQQRLRHSKATTTLNTYGHLWPDSD
ncbi:site-specific integrase [Streptomyces acidicola]|uniref:site-specific integrase n=1 Tax=Streptomyces acidicola TaxID=2596892 RepID=UPI00342B64B1